MMIEGPTGIVPLKKNSGGLQNGSTDAKAVMKAAHRIVSSYPSQEKAPEGYIEALIDVLSGYPVWLVELMQNPLHGIVAESKFIPAIAEIVQFAKKKLDCEREMESSREAGKRRAGLKAVPMGEREPDDPVKLALRKAFVTKVLGFDPLKGRKPQWCFDPLNPPANATWHDSAELAASAKRIKTAMEAAKEFEGVA